MAKKKTTEQFINQANRIHKNTYDYSSTQYRGANDKIKIICKEHGIFEQTPNNHLKGQGCKKCASIKFSKKYVKTTNQYIKDVKEVHGDIYDYSKVEYKGAHEKIIISCKVHGEFKQQASAHLKGQGCPKCAKLKQSKLISKTTNIFAEEAKYIHENKYDYSKTIYKKAVEKVTITCPIHGDFKQTPSNHLNGSGCPKCSHEYSSILNKEKPTGWSYSNWIKAAKKSKNFDSFKVYILKCTGNEEEFYKIGRTFLTIKRRFNQSGKIPYNYEVVKVFNGKPREICELEKQLQKDNKEFKYTPEISFGGMYECFKIIK